MTGIANQPQKIPFRWARDAGPGGILPVSLTSLIGVIDGRASLPTGFVPLNFQPVAAGGIPPFGGDHNGILQWLSLIAQWSQAGGPDPFDAAFSTAIGGYPRGARLASGRGGYAVMWQSLVDNNTNNPDTGGFTNTWASRGSNVIYLTATTTLTTQQNEATIACANSLQLNLPAAATLGGLTYDIYLWNPASTITLVSAGGNFVGYGTGTGVVNLVGGGAFYRVTSDGANWMVSAHATINSTNQLIINGAINGQFVGSSGNISAVGNVDAATARLSTGAFGSGDSRRVTTLADFMTSTIGTGEFFHRDPSGFIIQGSVGGIPAGGIGTPYSQDFLLPVAFPNNHMWTLATWGGNTPPNTGSIAAQTQGSANVRISINAPNGPTYGFGYISAGN